MTAVPLHRHGSNPSGTELMYSSFRLQRSSRTSAPTSAQYSNPPSRGVSAVRPSNSRAHSRSQSHSRSVSRSRTRTTASSNLNGKNRSLSRGRTSKLQSIPSHDAATQPPSTHASRATDSRYYEDTEEDEESTRGRRMRRRAPLTVAAEQHFREMAWESFRDRVREEIDSGNVQLASLLILVGGEKVLQDSIRSQTLVESYVGEQSVRFTHDHR